ncbi:MAG: hypothetical protein QGI41_10375 [Acidimicrobiales bacterium]|nr:hypothetical protein [Acidimicrobiales bacterium]
MPLPVQARPTHGAPPVSEASQTDETDGVPAAGERVAAAEAHTAAATVVRGGLCVDRSRGASRRGGDFPVTVIGTIRSGGDLLAPFLQLSASML